LPFSIALLHYRTYKQKLQFIEFSILFVDSSFIVCGCGKRNIVCSAVSLFFRRFRCAALSRALSKAVSKGLSACFDVAFRFPFVRSVRYAPLLAHVLPA
jgi:hypothetical protein